MTRTLRVGLCGLIASLVASIGACSGGTANLTALQKVRSGNVDVVLLSPRDALRHGADDFILEFRSGDGKLVDAGAVRATATMPMAGMPMFGSISVQRGDIPGRYRASGEFSMAGTWRLGIEFDGPAGKGSVTLPERVQ